MKINYVAEVDGFSGVRVYSRELMEALEEKVELEQVTPPRILRPSFLNKPMLNPLLFWRLTSGIIHVTNQDDLATVLPLPERDMVVTVHDIYPYVEDYAGPIYSLASKAYVRQLEKHAGRIIAVSEATKEQLVENTAIDGDTVRVIHEGVDLETFRPVDTDAGHGRYYLHVGSEIARKNLPGLVRIFSRIKERQPDAKLVRVGEPGRKARKALKEEDLRLGTDVVYENDVDTERLVELYSNAEKLLFPSHGEGFGRPILESLACGTPVVAYNRKPMSELLPGEMLVQPDDEISFAEKSLDLQVSEKGCRAHAENFTWEKAAEETIKVYGELS